MVAGAGDDGVEEGATDRAGVDGEAARPAADVGALAAGAGEESARPANRFGSRRAPVRGDRGAARGRPATDASRAAISRRRRSASSWDRVRGPAAGGTAALGTGRDGFFDTGEKDGGAEAGDGVGDFGGGSAAGRTACGGGEAFASGAWGSGRPGSDRRLRAFSRDRESHRPPSGAGRPLPSSRGRSRVPSRTTYPGETAWRA